uniref:Crp/Fnr family transcriptional regulator n=1 Tax=Gemmiger formicilis TaxID=745368 RepID=UPI003FF09239
MDYTPYYETMRRTSLLRGMTDAELDTLMACFAPRVRRYAKGELLLMAGYETHEVGLVLEGAITASKPLADGSTVVMARMGPGGVFADVLAGGRSRSPVNVSAAEACLALYLPCEALLRPCAALHSAHLKLLQNWLETISDKYFALDRRLELICCKSLRGRICMWLLEQRERCGADTFSTAMTRTELAAFLNCDRSALSRELSRMQEEGLIELFRGSFKLPDPERLMAGYETHEVGLVLEGAITASKPLADGSTVVMARMGPGGVFADVLAGGRSRSPVNVSAAEACLALYLPCEALLRPCAALHSAHLKLLQNWLETISDKYFALDRRLELICCKSLRGRICMWLLEQRERCGADTFSTAMTRTELAAFLNCDRSALSRELSRMQEEGLIELFRGSFKLPDPERLHAACPQF